jgi:SAM-dependent methyltransferase
MKTPVHEAAGGGFGRVAETYERARPDYPTEAVDRLIQELEVSRACSILDVGAGTGKLTRMLIPTGVRVTAVEPVASMRRALAREVPQAVVLAGTAEAVPAADGTVDGVVCAQAFHWFDGERALAEFHRVLKSHGRLALLWNLWDGSVDWINELSVIIDPYRGSTPNERTRAWRQAFAATDLFGTLNQLRFPHHQVMDEDGLVERVASISFIAVLPDDERLRVLDQARQLARSHPDLAGRDHFEFPYVTELYWCAKA